MQFSSRNSPTNLSKSRAVVRGAGHSTSCLMHRSLRNLFVSGVLKDVGDGNLTLRISSSELSMEIRLNGGVKSISYSLPSGPSGWYLIL
ncbi:hypothetical protein RP20_CCG013476 [Aedes albopictus]|nr:hypothetical protein RP20_CCG013476 [Aedes albopictus]